MINELYKLDLKTNTKNIFRSMFGKSNKFNEGKKRLEQDFDLKGIVYKISQIPDSSSFEEESPIAASDLAIAASDLSKPSSDR